LILGLNHAPAHPKFCCKIRALQGLRPASSCSAIGRFILSHRRDIAGFAQGDFCPPRYSLSNFWSGWYSPSSPARVSFRITTWYLPLPPPRLLPPHPRGFAGLTRLQYGQCPICQGPITNATALPSGYVYCYKVRIRACREAQARCPSLYCQLGYGN